MVSADSFGSTTPLVATLPDIGRSAAGSPISDPPRPIMLSRARDRSIFAGRMWLLAFYPLPTGMPLIHPMWIFRFSLFCTTHLRGDTVSRAGTSMKLTFRQGAMHFA